MAIPIAPKPVEEALFALLGLNETRKLYSPLKSSMFPGDIRSNEVAVGATNNG